MWSSADMPEINPNFLHHRLTMDEKVKPVVLRRRKFNEDKRLVIQEETQKLLDVGHVREILYPEWLTNVVLVRKANGRWRMCIDFTDLNKPCPKDSYPLPSIDSLVDNAWSFRLLSFLDAFSGHNQICMHPKDESKKGFMAEVASYCYKVMSFGLKSFGVTYQVPLVLFLSSIHPAKSESEYPTKWIGEWEGYHKPTVVVPLRYFRIRFIALK